MNSDTIRNIRMENGNVENRLRSINAVYENGVIENIKEGIVIAKESDGLRFEAVNVLPADQLLLVSIIMCELTNEYFSESETDDTVELFKGMLKVLISGLLNTNNQTKGAELQ